MTMNDQASPGLSTFEERLRAGQFVMTAEIAPPVSSDAQDLRSKAAPLKGLADAVNVTDGAGARAHMAALAAASILIGMEIEPILQITCRDKNRIALQSEMMGAAALGVRNLLLLTGDDPKAGDQPDTKPVFDVNSSTLIETARRLRDEGTLPTGRKVSGQAAFFIGAADMPIDPPAGWQPNALVGKIKSGAQFAQTQFCMDAGIVRRYVGAGSGRRHQTAGHPHRRQSAALGEIGAMDEKPPVRHHHRRPADRADGASRRPGARGHRHLRGIDRRLFDHSGHRRRPHHGARQRRGHSGSHRRGASEAFVARMERSEIRERHCGRPDHSRITLRSMRATFQSAPQSFEYPLPISACDAPGIYRRFPEAARAVRRLNRLQR